MKTLKWVVTISALASLAMASQVLGQENSGAPQGTQGKMKGNMRQMCADMMQKMQSEMKTQDAELDQLVKTMNAAKGDQKVQAMAAVIDKLVQQRAQAHAKMTERCNRMMQCMPDNKPETASPSPLPSPTASP